MLPWHLAFIIFYFNLINVYFILSNDNVFFTVLILINFNISG